MGVLELGRVYGCSAREVSSVLTGGVGVHGPLPTVWGWEKARP